MSFIGYLDDSQIPPDDRVPDGDHIIRVHGVHSRVMRDHYRLYRELMAAAGPLSPIQRELIGVFVSAINQCHY